MRPSFRQPDEMRSLILEPGFSPFAEGSCLVRLGQTHVLCTATIEERVPPFMRDSGRGWITAEYGMLPRSSPQRIEREAAKGKQTGRTHEIQRLIGRALRAMVDLKAMGERQIKLDCDVIQADGGTRTASITGSYVALYMAFNVLLKKGSLTSIPLREEVAAISCGIYNGVPVLDLDYAEDSTAEVDANFVLTSSGKIVEIQSTAESHPFEETAFSEMLRLARNGVESLVAAQREALKLTL